MAPCVSICIAKGRSEGWQFRTGTAGRLHPGAQSPISQDAPFDLASLTKPCVALTAAALASGSKLSLTRPIEAYLPELGHSPVARVTLELLLSHRSGLKPHLDLFKALRAKTSVNTGDMLRQIVRQGLVSSSDQQAHSSGHALYSDLGYLLAGRAIERALRKPLDELVGELLHHKLGLQIGSSRQWHDRMPKFCEIVAPTEHVSWRGGLLRGQVHDENAWAFAGHGLAGHAGLFGTSMAVAGLGCAVLDALAGRCEELGSFAAYYCTGWRNGGTLRAGFDGKSALRSSAGSLMGPCSFGHLGFTGTSLWCDPERRLVIAVLTNRVCPTRRNARLVAARGSIHDSLAHAVEIEESGRC